MFSKYVRLTKISRHLVAPRRQRRHRKGPHHLRDGKRFRVLLPRPAPTPQTAVHRSRTGKRRTGLATARPDQRPHTPTTEHVRFTDTETQQRRQQRHLIPRIPSEHQQQRRGRAARAIHATRHETRVQHLHRLRGGEERGQGRAV